MKKLLCLLLCLLTFLLPLSPFSFAAVPVNIEEAEDGTYFLSGITDTPQNESTDVLSRFFALFRRLIELLTGTKSVSKTKYISYFDTNGVLLWTVYLHAEFSYNGKKAVCRNASTSYEIFDPDWQVIAAEAGKNNSTAYADFTVRQTKLGVKLKTVTARAELSCSPDGRVE